MSGQAVATVKVTALQEGVFVETTDSDGHIQQWTGKPGDERTFTIAVDVLSEE